MTAVLPETPIGVPSTRHDPVAAVALVRRARRRTQRRARSVVGALVVVLIAVFLARVTLGDFIITLPDVVRIIGGAEIPGASYILMESKLPRAVLGVLAGIAFGLGGAIFQTTLRNPLASPDLIGVSMGASAAAVFAIVELGLTGWGVSAFALAGAVAISALVWWQGGGIGGNRLVLIGIAVAAGLLSVVQFLFTRADEWDAQVVLRWLAGSLNGVAWSSIQIFAVALLLLLPVVAWSARSLPVIELGERSAAGLGVPSGRAGLLLLGGVLLVACAVAASGPIAFAAFLAGPIARALNAGRTTLLGAALVGAILVVAADYLGAYAVSDVNFPVGVVTGACGAPFLLWLLASGRASRRHS